MHSTGHTHTWSTALHGLWWRDDDEMSINDEMSIKYWTDIISYSTLHFSPSRWSVALPIHTVTFFEFESLLRMRQSRKGHALVIYVLIDSCLLSFAETDVCAHLINSFDPSLWVLHYHHFSRIKIKTYRTHVRQWNKIEQLYYREIKWQLYIKNIKLQIARGGSVAEWLACWTQAQKGPGSNRSSDAVG